MPRYATPTASTSGPCRGRTATDFWTESPPPPKRAGSCHICVIGDSYIEARSVPVAQKVHVQLEELARQALPQLDVVTSAFGRSNTAQASQIAIYDKYASPLAPRVVVLFFSPNDFGGNSALTMAVRQGWDPERPPFAFPQRLADGRVRLLPPSPEYRRLERRDRFILVPLSPGYDLKPESMRCRADLWLRRTSYFAKWLRSKLGSPVGRRCRRQARAYWREQLGQRPEYRSLLADPSLLWQEQLALTAFALRSFAERVQRDGASLLVLSEFGVEAAHLQRITVELGIAVLSLHDYAVRQGLGRADLFWDHDAHWNEFGHQQAAAALLEYLKENQDLCRSPA